MVASGLVGGIRAGCTQKMVASSLVGGVRAGGVKKNRIEFDSDKKPNFSSQVGINNNWGYLSYEDYKKGLPKAPEVKSVVNRKKVPQYQYVQELQKLQPVVIKRRTKKGGNATAISGAVKGVADLGTEIAKGARGTDHVQDTRQNRRDIRKSQRDYNKFKKLQKKGKFPPMSDEELWEYVQAK